MRNSFTHFHTEIHRGLFTASIRLVELGYNGKDDAGRMDVKGRQVEFGLYFWIKQPGFVLGDSGGFLPVSLGDEHKSVTADSIPKQTHKRSQLIQNNRQNGAGHCTSILSTKIDSNRYHYNYILATMHGECIAIGPIFEFGAFAYNNRTNAPNPIKREKHRIVIIDMQQYCYPAMICINHGLT